MRVTFHLQLSNFVSPITNAFLSLKLRMAALWCKHVTATYAFSEQVNADCHLQMWRNFYRLKEIRQRDPAQKVRLQESDFLELKKWAGRGFFDFYAWLSALKTPIIKNYLQNALKLSPRSTDFPKQTLFHPVRQAEQKTFAPLFLKEYPKEKLSVALPLYEERGQFFCYDATLQSYECVKHHGNGKKLSLNDFDFTEGQKQSLPSDFNELELQKLPGRKHFILAIDTRMGVSEAEKKFFIKEIGTYKLLLLNLGLDYQNNPITDASEEASVAKALQNELCHTSWASDSCQKEHLLEYAIAELFKRDQDLFEKVKKCVDFYFKIWALYERVAKIKRNTFSQKNIEQYLPGKEQMLAFCLMKNVQYLWWAAICTDTFCQNFGLPKCFKFVPFFLGPKRYQKSAYNSSFISVWQEVKTKLQTTFPEEKDWVSMSGHGTVVSFDKDLIEQQNQCPISNKRLAQDLGIACIDSVARKNVFYMQASN